MNDTSKSKKLSDNAIAVLKQLSEKQKKTLRRNNPFKTDRNELLCELRSRGVFPNVLSEITGLSRVSIWKIVRDYSGIKDGDFSGLRKHLKAVQKAVGKLTYYIEAIRGRNK
ncbi:MAG: hypothetical protein C4522_02730 [Desulfobacteraceae bacterium]|nr:MAG: hypothetical protein C4522_02730 [Desulfobacteraceae bacterium]